MVTELLGTLLQELGQSLGVRNLQPDANNSCLLKYPDGQEIQVELDDTGEFLLIGAKLGPVPPGRYREDLFVAALKANAMPHPLHGILCYGPKADNMLMFQKINIKDLNGARIAAEIPPFVEKARLWTDAIKRGDVPLVTQEGAPRSSGMFGLH